MLSVAFTTVPAMGCKHANQCPYQQDQASDQYNCTLRRVIIWIVSFTSLLHCYPIPSPRSSGNVQGSPLLYFILIATLCRLDWPKDSQQTLQQGGDWEPQFVPSQPTFCFDSGVANGKTQTKCHFLVSFAEWENLHAGCRVPVIEELSKAPPSQAFSLFPSKAH